MDEYIHSRLVHFATLDVEGAEYGILNELKYGGIFDEAGVIFCQVPYARFSQIDFFHIKTFTKLRPRSKSLAPSWR